MYGDIFVLILRSFIARFGILFLVALVFRSLCDVSSLMCHGLSYRALCFVHVGLRGCLTV